MHRVIQYNQKAWLKPYIDISKTLMYEFWYDHIKPKYQDRAKLC